MSPSKFSSGAPIEIDAHLQSLFYLTSRVPSKRVLPPGSLHRATIERERCPSSRAPFSHPSKSPVDEPTPGCPSEERFLSPEPSFHNPGSPVKGALRSEPLQREMPHS